MAKALNVDCSGIVCPGDTVQHGAVLWDLGISEFSNILSLNLSPLLSL